MCYTDRAQAHTAGHGGLEGSLLPEGSGDAESPAWLLRQLAAYERGLEAAYAKSDARPRKKRRPMSDYTTKNCEEAYAYGAWECAPASAEVVD